MLDQHDQRFERFERFERDERLAAVREHWDAAAAVYDSIPSHGLRTERERRAWCSLLARLLPARPCRVLDVGTGTGFVAQRLAELGYDVVGVDVSAHMLAIARQAAPAITFAEGTADLETFGSAEFDAVVCRHLLWTLPAPEATLRRWREVLVPSGTAIAIDGTWFGGTVQQRAARRVAGLLRRLTGAPRERGSAIYGTVGADEFPLLGARSAVPTVNAFARAGFVDVRSEYLDGLDAVERSGLSFAERLAQQWRRFVVEARAPQ
jgi:SAM-dependent methyltransferase